MITKTLRALVVALVLALFFHFLADYFGWHVFSEAGGRIVSAFGRP